MNIASLFKKTTATYIAIALFSMFILWWALFFFAGIPIYDTTLWGMIYQFVAVFGVMVGFYSAFFRASNKNEKRILFAFTIGLLFQCIGQTSFGLYIIYLGTSIPYPSPAEIAFFASNFCYLYGAILFFRERSAQASKSVEKFQIILIFVVMYILSYIFLLQDYHFDLSKPVTILLDLGYPISQAAYISCVIVSSKFSPYARLFLPALMIQYFADFNFVYQANQGTWGGNGSGDVIYLCSYVLMTLALIHVNHSKSNQNS